MRRDDYTGRQTGTSYDNWCQSDEARGSLAKESTLIPDSQLDRAKLKKNEKLLQIILASACHRAPISALNDDHYERVADRQPGRYCRGYL